MIVLAALILLAVLLIIWTACERFTAVEDPEQYVNSTLIAKY
jgi:hypothetical protein